MKRRQRRSRESRRSASARLAAAGGLGITAALAAPGAAHAAAVDFTVNTGGDAGDGMCEALPGGCTLRDALVDSSANNNTADVDRILFASSVTGTINVLGAELPQIDEHLNIVGPGAATLTVNGGATYRALFIDAPLATDVTVSGLTLTGHRAADGGALYSLNANLTLDGVTVTASGTTGGSNPGGGIYSVGGEVTISDSTIAGNSTTGNSSYGGGVHAKGAPLTIERSTISGNSTVGTSARGGGVYARDGALTIEDSTISGNSTAGEVGHGGGVYVRNGAVAIRDSTISGNSTAGPSSIGGGVFSTGGTLEIERSTISGNSADGSGGIAGGVFTNPGIFSPELRNTIVANNSAGFSDPDLDTSSADFAIAYTLIEEPPPEDDLFESVPGSNLLGIDPQLGPLASNGGPTRTHALSATSPAVDSGSTTVSDQRGTPRPFDVLAVPNGTAAGVNAADIGSFELDTEAACKGRPETVLGNTGTPGPDVIVGTSGPDLIRGVGGNDLVCGGAGNDRVIGGPGNDALHGEGGNDTLKGGSGKDRLFGEAGKDRLLGQGGRDRLIGGPGRDRLRGGPGRDRLLGGPGKDRQAQ